MTQVEFILPGLFDFLYSFGAWWVLGYYVYGAFMSSCVAVVDTYSAWIALFMGDFSQSYIKGATLCNEAARTVW